MRVGERHLRHDYALMSQGLMCDAAGISLLIALRIQHAPHLEHNVKITLMPIAGGERKLLRERVQRKCCAAQQRFACKESAALRSGACRRGAFCQNLELARGNLESRLATFKTCKLSELTT